ncbi:hypothetical protein Dsin_030088 [Dipteronia sinensis]|uniref:Retrotransposon gag domain-containing protein n=1 Tax=Dipteronia sinensis TaxID=43782 RepID=A0AAD9ZID7_9ROSI|nr:hypothetical protein Dsin_030088 [Dipteronia sinensis]
MHSTLQTVLTELHALRVYQTQTQTYAPNSSDMNPFAFSAPSSSGHHTSTVSSSHIKIYFLNFSTNNPTGWNYQVEQYFEFQNIAPTHQVQLASLHLEGIALQWHKWLTRFNGPFFWDEFTHSDYYTTDEVKYEPASA